MGNLRVGPIVRAIHPDGVAIWTEWNQPCSVTLAARSISDSQDALALFSTYSSTVAVGGHYYALSLLTGLQPATWYSYQVSSSIHDDEPVSEEETTILQCFRTLDPPSAGTELRLAYGSCRKLSAIEPDALSAFGFWLRACVDEREVRWPHLLLMIGDQIYADKPLTPQPTKHAAYHSAKSFDDYASIYIAAWSGDEGVRQVLAALPTYMIFDDHEITNGWNNWPGWRARVLQKGSEQMLVDGLVAYWIYQGWGNIALQRADEHELFLMMQQGMQNGEDLLEALHGRMRQAVYQEKALQWHYEIPTMPPLFVTDLRADRPAKLDRASNADVLPRIMSQHQMASLRVWAQAHDSSTAILVSSVPAFLPPMIGFAEYVMGVRLFQQDSAGLLRRLGRILGSAQQKLARRLSFDHWPVFGATWKEFITVLASRKHDLVILSGDVHFSYSLKGECTAPMKATERRPHFYQLVASPFKNTLEPQDRRLILGQARIKAMRYGGLHSSILPLWKANTAERVPLDMLFQNLVALVTFSSQIQNEGYYSIRQVYLGVVNNTLEELAVTEGGGKSANHAKMLGEPALD